MKVLGKLQLVLSAATVLCFSEAAMAADSVVSGCSGVSLPPSVVTDILGPVVTGAVTPLENTTNGVLGALTPLLGPVLPAPVNTDISGLLRGAAAGAPVTLSALRTDGTLVGPGDNCIVTSDGYQMNQPSGIAIGGNRISGLGAGTMATAGGADALALGNGAVAASGPQGTTAIGTNAQATTSNSVALGAGSIASSTLRGAVFDPGGILAGASAPAGEVSIGSAGNERRLTNLAAGAEDTDGATVGQLRSLQATMAAVTGQAVEYDDTTRTVATLRGVTGTRLANVAPGEISATSMDAVNGSQLNATNQALAQLSSVSVTYDVDQQGRRTNSVTLRGGQPSQPVAIHNVAPGVADTDAVNVGQLRAATFDAGSARGYVDQQIGSVRDEARQAAAIGLAAGSLKFDGTPGKVSFGASGGVWRGASAFAMGMGYTDQSGRVRANATATTAGGAWGAGGGLTMTLN